MGDRMKHLVDIHGERCIGCTRCMRACPTEAIRIIDDKAHLLKERCIFCGNCIVNCHKNAYKVYSDSFANLSQNKINVAILPLAVYGMTINKEELGGVYKTIMNFGFDEIFDLSIVTEMLIEKIESFIRNRKDTYIISQCPTVVRLIQLKYPQLLPNLLPFDFPFEVAAKLSKKVLSKKYNINEDDVGVSYISECLSNFIAIKEALGKENSHIDNVFLFNDIFRNSIDKDKTVVEVVKKGIQFAKVGAFKHITNNNDVLAVDGIKQVDEILEKIYLNRLKNVKLIEAYSCIGGCVGGNFALENPFVAKWKVNQFYDKLDDSLSSLIIAKYKTELIDDEWLFTENLKEIASFKLSNNIDQSLIKLNKINQILKDLPNIDCCACGSPSCRAFAEDVVNEVKTLNGCFILGKE